MIVLLHGFTGGPTSFDPLLAALGVGPSEVVRPILSGHGLWPALAPSWESELDRLTAMLSARGVRDAHLVGYSLGGRIGWGLLAHAPHLFARATLIGAHPGLEDAAARAARRHDDARWIELLNRDGLDAFLSRWEALPLWSTQPPTLVEAQRPIRRSHRAEGLAHALRVLGLGMMPPVDPARIDVPVELVVGALDAKHRALAEAFAPRVGATVHVVPGAGHNVLAEQPAALARILAR